MNVTAIVPAAGTGDRMQHKLKKPYISLLGKPMLAYTLEVLDAVPAIQEIIVPVYPGEERLCEADVVRPLSLRTPVRIIAGGERRQDSVKNGLAALAGDCDVVLVHDGARPLVTCALVEASIQATLVKKATTLAVPVKDTITMVAKDTMTITRTPQRDILFIIQTPQTFEKSIILKAHQQACDDGFKGTDDASLVERLGIPVTVVMGSYANIKITTQEDLLFAEAFMKGQHQ